MKTFAQFERTAGSSGTIYVNPDYVICLTPSPSDPASTRIHLQPTPEDNFVTVVGECADVADALERSV